MDKKKYVSFVWRKSQKPAYWHLLACRFFHSNAIETSWLMLSPSVSALAIGNFAFPNPGAHTAHSPTWHLLVIFFSFVFPSLYARLHFDNYCIYTNYKKKNNYTLIFVPKLSNLLQPSPKIFCSHVWNWDNFELIFILSFLSILFLISMCFFFS